MTNCSHCGRETPEDEVQKCELCGVDGLGNCCIGDMDHPCDQDPNHANRQA